MQDYGGITEEELDRMQAVLYALAVKFLDETGLKEFKEAMVMTKLGQNKKCEKRRKIVTIEEWRCIISVNNVTIQ